MDKSIDASSHAQCLAPTLHRPPTRADKAHEGGAGAWSSEGPGQLLRRRPRPVASGDDDCHDPSRRRSGPAPIALGGVTRSDSCRCTPTPTTRRRRARARLARYTAEGVHRRALVCCTGGEEARSSTPRHDTPKSAPTSARSEWRSSTPASTRSGTASSTCSATTSSGMADTEANARPDNFANAPLDEAVGKAGRRSSAGAAAGPGHVRRRAVLLHAPRPHPGARDLGGGVRRHQRYRPVTPSAGTPWQPSKLYYSGFSFRRIQAALHDAYKQSRGEPLRRAHRADGSGVGVRATSDPRHHPRST